MLSGDNMRKHNLPSVNIYCHLMFRVQREIANIAQLVNKIIAQGPLKPHGPTAAHEMASLSNTAGAHEPTKKTSLEVGQSQTHAGQSRCAYELVKSFEFPLHPPRFRKA